MPVPNGTGLSGFQVVFAVVDFLELVPGFGEQLLDHTWPGNLSELYSCLEHAITLTTDGLIGPEDFPTMRQHLENDTRATLPVGSASMEDLTKLTLTAALDACGGNRRRAALRL